MPALVTKPSHSQTSGSRVPRPLLTPTTGIKALNLLPTDR